jgi:carbamoyl-phosphate synthase large subunit
MCPLDRVGQKEVRADAFMKTVLVTGTGGRSVGSGILHAILRSSPEVRARWRVVAADADPFAWGLYQADAAVLLPVAHASDYVSAVERVVREQEIDAIIPGTEVEIEILLRNAAAFAPAVVIANRLDLLPLMLDKFETAQRLASLGYTPLPTVPLAEWPTIVERWGFPLVVKPTRGTGGSRGLHLVMDEDELRRLLPRMDDRTDVCAQPYVGDCEQEYTVGVLCDRAGNLIDSIVMHRKLIGLSLLASAHRGDRRYAISTGYSQGFIVKAPGIQAFCEQLALRLGSCGPLNIQLRLDPVTKAPWIFEIHPRFSGTTPIRADVGFNEVDVLLRNWLLGETFSRLEYRTDVAAIRAFEYVIVPTDQLLR